MGKRRSFLFILFISLWAACVHRSESGIPSDLKGVLDRGESWTLVEFHHLSDGGTRCYFFTNELGDTISLWEANSLDTHADPYQSYYIRHEGSENFEKTEVLRGSELEKEIFAVLNSSGLSEERQQEGYDGDRMLQSLEYGIKSRDKTIRSYSRFSREDRRSLGMDVTQYDREVIWYRKRGQERNCPVLK